MEKRNEKTWRRQLAFWKGPKPQKWMTLDGQKVKPLRVKMGQVLAIYLVIAFIIGWLINNSVSLFNLENFGLHRYNENLAEDLRNFVWTIGFAFGGLLGVWGFSNSLHRTEQKDWELEAERLKTMADQTARNRQIDSEIFARSVEQLGHDKPAIRLGGLYAIENLARSTKARELDEDNKAFLNSLLETLSAYVREQAPRTSDEQEENMRENDPPLPKTKTDVEAAIRIISRTFDYELRCKINASIVDLRSTYLPQLEMPSHSDLQGFDFSHAYLLESKLKQANLSKTKFLYTNLRSADLSYSNMAHCKIIESNLTRANLSHASLVKTHFARSALGYASLDNVDLTYAKFNRCSLKNTSMFFADISGLKIFRIDNPDYKTWFEDAIPESLWNPKHPPQVMSGEQAKNANNIIEVRNIEIRKYGVWEEYLEQQNTKET